MSTLESIECDGTRLPNWALAPWVRRLAVAVAFAGASACCAQGKPTGLDVASLQYEADYRVIAARCGTPAFEKKFFTQSRAFVAASNGHDKEAAARQESAIRSLRRNPITLIGSQADCKSHGQVLQRVMAERSRAGNTKTVRGP